MKYRMLFVSCILLFVLITLTGCGEKDPSSSVIIPVKPPAPKVIEITSKDGGSGDTINNESLEPVSSDPGS